MEDGKNIIFVTMIGHRTAKWYRGSAENRLDVTMVHAARSNQTTSETSLVLYTAT